MLIDEIHYRVNLKRDELGDLDTRNFLPNEIDSYINAAIIKILIDKYDVFPSIRKGFETDQKRISELQYLHIISPVLQPAVTPINLGQGYWEINLDTLGDNINGRYFRYMFLTKLRVKIKSGQNCFKVCEGYFRREDNKINTFNQASLKWCRVPFSFGKSTHINPYINSSPNTKDFSEDFLNSLGSEEMPKLGSIYLNTNNTYGVPQFDIEEVYIDYIKYPNKVFFGGYDSIDGLYKSTDPQVHSDLPELLHELVVEVAVMLMRGDILNNIQIDTNLVAKNRVTNN